MNQVVIMFNIGLFFPLLIKNMCLAAHLVLFLFCFFFFFNRRDHCQSRGSKFINDQVSSLIHRSRVPGKKNNNFSRGAKSERLRTFFF